MDYFVNKGETRTGINLYDTMSMYVMNGGTANRTTVNAGGSMSVQSGGIVSSTTVNSGGELRFSGGTAVCTILNNCLNDYCFDGGMYLQDGMAKSTTVNSGGYLKVGSRGTANSTTVNSGGSMSIKSGGTANRTTVNAGGNMKIDSGGKAYSTVLSGESFIVSSGDLEYKEYKFGEMFVLQGGSAVNTFISSGGKLTVESGGFAGSTILDDKGQMDVRSGGVVFDTTLSKGCMALEGVASNVTVTDFRCLLHVFDTGKVTGLLTTGADAVVIVDEGGVIDFDISALEAATASVRVNNLSLIQGAPTYTVTVSSDQTTGTYKLAQGAGSFSGNINIRTGTGGKYGVLSVGGSLKASSGRTYTLSKDSGLLSLTVSSDDKIPPAKPTVKASTTATAKSITLTATFSSDSAKKQYSTDNKTWKTYSKALTVSANGTYYFREIDAAGNISAVTSYKVSNISTAPAKPTVKASTTAATNKNITLTAAFSSDSTKKQYSTDNKTWKAYSSALTVSANGTYYFRGIDAAGNISAVTSYKVSNIDKVAPAKPTVKASTTAVTNKNVTLTATFSTDSAKKQYSKDNKNWMTYSKALTVTANATYYFRGTDAAGNLSAVTSYKVTNIDKTAPVKPTVKANTTAATNKNITLTATFSTDSAKKQYSKDNKNWLTYSKALTVTANGTYYFRGTDAAGNISTVTSYKVTNIDKTAPAKPTVTVSTTAMTNKSVTVKAAFSSDSAKKQYSTDNKTWKTYSSALTVKANATYYFRGIDKAGNISSVVSKKISNICPKGDFTNDTLAAAKAKTALKLSSARKITGWVGLGDPKDFIKLEVVKKGKVSLDMNAATAKAQKAGEVKLSLLNSAGKAVAVSALDSDTLATKSKVAAGIYYLGVACANVNKYSTDYTIKAGMLAS